MIRFSQSGNFKNMERFLKRAKGKEFYARLSQYGQEGVRALQAATPVKTGKTASSWGYKTSINDKKIEVVWYNTNTNNGVNIAAVIQYGHGLPQGGFVYGIDYINPALKPIFKEIADSIWEEVRR